MNAEEIKSLRISMKLTQQEFAVQLGVAVATVSRWERGITQPSNMVIRLISLLTSDADLDEQERRLNARLEPVP